MKFDLDGPIMSVLTQLADVVLCNIMFCLFSLPIFTIGASLSALYRCVQDIIDDEDREFEGNIVRKFWTAFKENFSKGTILWLICLLAFVFLGIYYMVVLRLEGQMGQVYRISFYVLCFVFLIGYQYIFPMQARYENRVRDTLKNAWLLGIAALPWTLLSIALVAAAVYISFFMNPDGAYLAVFIWIAGGFGLIAYFNSLFFRQSFRKWRQDEKPGKIE